MKKFLASLIALSLMLVGCSTKKEEAPADTVVLSYVDMEGNTVEEYTVEFFQDDTLVALTENAFDNVVIENGMLMEMEDYKTPEDWSSFISIYVNDEMSMVGIEEIELVKDMHVSYIVTEYVAE